jgi:DNA repair protein RadC
MEVCLRRRMERRPLINSHEKAIDYLHRRLAYECREKLAVIFLTRRLRFLHYEEISFGSLSETPYCTRTIATRALEVNAGAIIVAHNHPSGNPDPTGEDRQMGYVLQRLCADLGIDLVDNIIIASTGSRSILQESRNEEALRSLQRNVAVDATDQEVGS